MRCSSKRQQAAQEQAEAQQVRVRKWDSTVGVGAPMTVNAKVLHTPLAAVPGGIQTRVTGKYAPERRATVKQMIE
jgi:hypothetical protein